MVVTDYNTKFLDKAGTDHLIEELKAYIDDIATGDIDLSSYVTKQELQGILDELHIDVDLSTYATKEELIQAISNIDLSAYATTEYVDKAIASVSTSGEVNLDNYYTKEETYNKVEIDNIIPDVTNGKDGVDGKDGADGQDGFSPVATVSKSGNTATITITDKNGTTTATVSDGKDGTGGGSSGGGGEVYSTEEKEIGVWIDGRTIYREIFEIDLPAMTTASPDVGNVYFWDAPCNKELLNYRAIVYNGLSTKEGIYPQYILNGMSYYAIETWSSKTTVSAVSKALEQCKFGIYPMASPTHLTSGRYRLLYGSKYANKKAVFIMEYVKSIIE